MSSKYKLRDAEIPYFITFTIVGWLDVFTRDDYRDIVVNCLQYCIENKALNLHAWVIMTNHVHLIVSSPTNNLSGLVRDIKKYMSKKITEAVLKNKRESRREWIINMLEYAGKVNNDNKYYQFWKKYYHPVQLSNSRRLEIALNYLHNNPVKAGFVWEPWHYKYSSGIDYYTNEKGLIVIHRL